MLYHETSGNGPDLTLIHGFCENSTCFSRQVLLLNKHFRITLIDLPGAGNSQVIHDLSMEKMADEVHEVLQNLGFKKYVMAGHSMGGYVTLAYARKYSNFLSGMGLIHSTANADNEERRLKREQAIRIIGEKGFETYVKNFVPPLFAPEYKEKEVVEGCIREGLRTSAEGLKEAILAMKSRQDSNALLEETNLPVLFVAGKQDAIIPESDIFKQSGSVKSAQLVYLEHSGHMGMIEEPGKCAEGIASFVNYCNTGT